MTNTKMTKREYLVNLLDVVKETEHEIEFKDFLEHEIELLDNKKKNSKPTKTQKENEELMNQIVETMATFTEPLTITEMQKKYSPFSELSNQKISSLMRKLIAEEKVVRTVNKKKAHFSLKDWEVTKSNL